MSDGFGRQNFANHSPGWKLLSTFQFPGRQKRVGNVLWCQQPQFPIWASPGAIWGYFLSSFPLRIGTRPPLTAPSCQGKKNPVFNFFLPLTPAYESSCHCHTFLRFVSSFLHILYGWHWKLGTEEEKPSGWRVQRLKQPWKTSAKHRYQINWKKRKDFFCSQFHFSYTLHIKKII